MKRFNVQGMRLYYSSLEEAIKNNPDTEITECNDTDYLTDITKIKECFQFAGFLSHDEHSVRELYKGKNSHETIEILLFRDPTDKVYYDYLRYRRQVVGDLIVKTLWDVSNPHDFCQRFLSIQPLKYHVTRSFTKKLPKPKELKGIKPICSVLCWEGWHDEGQTRSQLFRKGSDLWIRCPSYSIIYDNKVTENGITGCYYQSMAWSVYQNFFDIMNVCTPKQMTEMCVQEYCRFHKLHEPLNMEWRRYLERICNEVYRMTKVTA